MISNAKDKTLTKKKKKGKSRCIGYGKCMEMTVETIIEEEDTNESEVEEEREVNEKKERGSIDSDMEEHVVSGKHCQTFKTVFRFVENGNCKHKCELKECINYSNCGSKLPQWKLNLGKGYCDQCIHDDLNLIDDIMTPSTTAFLVQQRRNTI